jgi:hypothetical protein
LEGYYCDYGRPIAESERVRFVSDEQAPDFDPLKAPVLDSARWPEERLKKVERSYAMEYVRSLIPTMLELFGPRETRDHLGRAARLIGMQLYDETAALLDVAPGSARSFADYLGQLAAAQGETIDVIEQGEAIVLRQSGWRLMQGVEPHASGFEAWAMLFEGALSIHNRHLRLSAKRTQTGLEWRITG